MLLQQIRQKSIGYRFHKQKVERYCKFNSPVKPLVFQLLFPSLSYHMSQSKENKERVKSIESFDIIMVLKGLGTIRFEGGSREYR